MIRNYFKIAWRNLRKNSFYSGINILGLFAGLAFTLLIGTYIWGEFEVNSHLKNADRQVILLSDWKEANMGIEFTTLGPLAKRLKEDYPSLVENYFRWDGITSNISFDNKSFREGILIAETSFLEMYDFELLYGNKKELLKNPYSVILTEEKALKYFGKIDVIGESVKIQNFSGGEHDFRIEGVLKEIPKNSITNLNSNDENGFFISYDMRSFFDRGDFDDWNNIFVPSYLELKEGIMVDDLKAPIASLINQHARDRTKLNLTIRPTLLSDYYLQKDNGLVNRMVYTLMAIGIFILLMASINFINISVSTASNRMKEIGVRKVLGSLKTQIIYQFLMESFIIVCFATLLALIVFPILRPVFSELVGVEIQSLNALPTLFIPMIISLVFILTLLAGLYPAFVLSSLKAVDSLKGKLTVKTENVFLNKTLVGLQFSIALVVLISSLIITQQIDYFFGKNLGYNKDFVISAQVPRDWSAQGVEKMETIRNIFESQPHIISTSLSYEIPNGNNGLQRSVFKVGSDASKAVVMKSLTIDENYVRTYQIPLLSGTSFINQDSLNATDVMINEEAVKMLDLKNPEFAIGKQVRVQGSDITYTIKGVTQNFHFSSMHQSIEPIIMYDVHATQIFRYLNFKISSKNIAGSLSSLQKKWATLIPGAPMEYTFMDESLAKLYNTEIQLKKATYNGAILTLLIVLLGVIGLVSLKIRQRIKEIGIRKILGASPRRIIALFAKDFLGIILVSGAISFPISYVILEDWLNNFVYSIPIPLAPFVYAILGLSSIIMLTIGILTWKAAIINPIKNIRVE